MPLGGKNCWLPRIEAMRFPYSGQSKPLLGVTLTLGGQSLWAEGLLDSGSDVNVLPFGKGGALGAVWDPRKTTLRLGGTFAGTPAMPLLLIAKVGDLLPVRLAFGWCETDDVPLIFGQTNFFMEFDICFFRSRGSPVQPLPLSRIWHVRRFPLPSSFPS